MLLSLKCILKNQQPVLPFEIVEARLLNPEMFNGDENGCRSLI